MYNPCHVMRAHLPGWSLAWALLPDDLLGTTCWVSRTITLDIRMPTLGKRATLAHEVERVLLGPGVDEATVEATAARKMIAFEDLVEAWSPDEGLLAERLMVDVPMLRARLAGLSWGERSKMPRELLPEP